MEEILSLYKERIRYINLAHRYIRDYSTAEEMVQQCIFKLMKSKDEQYVSDAKVFFAAVIRNHCLNYMKRKQKEYEVDSTDSGMEWANVDIERLTVRTDEESVSDFPELLEKCRKLLPEASYEIFMAKRMDRMSYKDISRIYMISENRINFEIKKAVKVFREVFKDYNIFVFLTMLYI